MSKPARVDHKKIANELAAQLVFCEKKLKDAEIKTAAAQAEHKAQLDELHAIANALGTSEGRSSVSHIEALRRELATCQAENLRMRDALDSIQDLINESSGVYGLHLNGDPSPWEELLPGGRFEEWLCRFSEALSTPPGEQSALRGYAEQMLEQVAEWLDRNSMSSREYAERLRSGEWTPEALR